MKIDRYRYPEQTGLCDLSFYQRCLFKPEWLICYHTLSGRGARSSCVARHPPRKHTITQELQECSIIDVFLQITPLFPYRYPAADMWRWPNRRYTQTCGQIPQSLRRTFKSGFPLCHSRDDLRLIFLLFFSQLKHKSCCTYFTRRPKFPEEVVPLQGGRDQQG